MTTAIAPRPNQTNIERTEVENDSGVHNFAGLVAMGEALTKTGFLPEHIRTGPQFAAIVMTGKELGMTPMRAVRSLSMVKGKVVEDSASQLARFKHSGGSATFLHLDETKAVLELTHPNGDKHTETWTAVDVKTAGLQGGMFAKYPKAMLRARVITAGLKSLGWDGAVGTYDPDEFAVDNGAVEVEARAPDPAVAAATAAVEAERKAAAKVEADKVGAAKTLAAVDDLAEDLMTAADADALAVVFERIGDVAAKVGPKNESNVKAKLIALGEKKAATLADAAWTPADNDIREAVLKLERRVEERQLARKNNAPDTTTTNTQAA